MLLQFYVEHHWVVRQSQRDQYIQHVLIMMHTEKKWMWWDAILYIYEMIILYETIACMNDKWTQWIWLIVMNILRSYCSKSLLSMVVILVIPASTDRTSDERNEIHFVRIWLPNWHFDNILSVLASSVFNDIFLIRWNKYIASDFHCEISNVGFGSVFIITITIDFQHLYFYFSLHHSDIHAMILVHFLCFSRCTFSKGIKWSNMFTRNIDVQKQGEMWNHLGWLIQYLLLRHTVGRAHHQNILVFMRR